MRGSVDSLPRDLITHHRYQIPGHDPPNGRQDPGSSDLDLRGRFALTCWVISDNDVVVSNPTCNTQGGPHYLDKKRPFLGYTLPGFLTDILWLLLFP